MIERGVIRFDADVLSGLELPLITARGSADGPRVTLLAGIHGCEYSSIAAAVRFMRALDTTQVRGVITAVPIVNVPSFEARSPFVTPQDGKNLNRCFPGSLDGTYSEALARSVFDELIAVADVVVDLHGGDMVEALEPFCLYDESAVEAQSRALAVSFGLPYVVRSERQTSLSGTTSSAAASAGVPAIIAEAGGCGLLEEDAIALLVGGVSNALRHVGALVGEPSPPPVGMRHIERFVWLRSGSKGWWESSVRAGDEVEAGGELGVVQDSYGDVVDDVVAPEAGVVLFVTTSPAIAVDGILLGLGTGLRGLDEPTARPSTG